MAVSATEEELEELRATIVGGAQSVEADGRKVVYRSLMDLLHVRQLLSEAAGRARRRLTAFSRGYE
jgi:hypothetical protein